MAPCAGLYIITNCNMSCVSVKNQLNLQRMRLGKCIAQHAICSWVQLHFYVSFFCLFSFTLIYLKSSKDYLKV